MAFKRDKREINKQLKHEWRQNGKESGERKGKHQSWQLKAAWEVSWDVRQPTLPQPLWKTPEPLGAPHMQ